MRLLSGTIVTELASAFHGGNQWKTHGETNGNPPGGGISWRNPWHFMVETNGQPMVDETNLVN